MAAISQRYILMQFREWKVLYFDYSFTDVCSCGSNLGSIGLGISLAPNGQQAITWTNVDPVHWRIYAARGGDELIYCVLICFGQILSPWILYTSSGDCERQDPILYQ